jgi:hypothetical protein
VASVIDMLPVLHATLWHDAMVLVSRLLLHMHPRLSSMLGFVLVVAFLVPTIVRWFERCVLLVIVITHGIPPTLLISRDG